MRNAHLPIGQAFLDIQMTARAHLLTRRCSEHRRDAAIPSLRSVSLNSMRWTTLMNRTARFVLLAVCAFTAGAAYADFDCSNEATQQGMNICAANAARAADSALASEYQLDLKDSQADRRTLLTAAQKSWSSYRDAQCSLEASQFSGGTMQPFALAACRERLATERTRALNEFWHEAIDK